MEDEPWKGLDLDDSDLSSSSSLLRRCSRQQQHQPSQQGPLNIVSSQPPNLSLSSLPSLPPPPPPPQPQRQPLSSASHRLIPGPAGAIQAAMHRNGRLTSYCNAEPLEISTQEYVCRVQEDAGEEFTRNPWNFALDFIRCSGTVYTTPLSDIKKCVDAERVDKVIAIVKSCTPNGLGDMLVTLKDPTDTIGASVHRKVLNVGKFGKLLVVGSVLILQKVVGFSFLSTSSYLNITRSNVVKIISIDCGVHNFPEANICSTPVISKSLAIPEKLSPTSTTRTEGILEDMRQSYHLKGKAVIDKLMGKENSTKARSLTSSYRIENGANNISKELLHSDLAGSGHRALGFYNKQPGPCVSEGMARQLEDPDSVEKQRQVRDFSSAPSTIESLDSRTVWRENGAEVGRLLRGRSCATSMAKEFDIEVQNPAGTSSSLAENLDIGSASEVQKQRQQPGASSSENLAYQDTCKTIDAQKRRQPIDTNSSMPMGEKKDDRENGGANGVKMQRVALISRTSVQEWTDEQLGILDMDED